MSQNESFMEVNLKHFLHCALAFFPSEAFAGYINNKSEWEQASSLVKLGYVIGAYDGLVVFLAGNDELNQYNHDLSDCAISMKLVPADLLSIVDAQYQVLENWDKPPNLILSQGLRRVCLATINAARNTRGQTPYN